MLSICPDLLLNLVDADMNLPDWPVWRDMPESSFKSQSSAAIEIGEMLLANEI